MKRIFDEYVNQQRTMQDIADGLTADGILSSGGRDHWEPTAVRWILNNPVYTGLFRRNTHSHAKYHSYRGGEIAKGANHGPNDEADWIVIEDNHVVIIDKQTFNRGQRLLEKRKGRKTRYSRDENPYLLSGLLVCGNCGSLLWGIKNYSNAKPNQEQRYECSKRRREGTEACEGCTVGENVVLDFLVQFIEHNFISSDDQTRLLRKAKQGKLHESDLPKAFKKLKRLIAGREVSKSKTKDSHRQLVDVEAKIAKARSNLVLLDPENIPAAQEQISKLVSRKTRLQKSIGKEPNAGDVNEMVADVLTKLFWLSSLHGDDLRPALKQLEQITVYATASGAGAARRYAFDHGEVKFAGPVSRQQVVSLPTLAARVITGRVGERRFLHQPLNPALHRGMIALLQSFRHCRTNRIEVHVCRARQQRGFIGQSRRVVSILEKSAGLLVFAICPHRHPLTQQPHPPVQESPERLGSTLRL